jgi:hypothetical protein
MVENDVDELVDAAVEVEAILDDHETGVSRDGVWQAACTVDVAAAAVCLTDTRRGMGVVADSILPALEVFDRDHWTTGSRAGKSTQYCEVLHGEAYELDHRRQWLSQGMAALSLEVVEAGAL